MSTTITIGASTIVPDIVDGYESTREGSNIVHPILGSSEPDATLRPALLRAGRLVLVFGDETAAKEAEDAHATATVPASLASTDLDTIAMTYVVAGSITRTLDDETRDAWVVTIEYQEVAP